MTSTHIRFDSFLPVSWSRSYGDRAFQFDAFVSHNRGDAHSKHLLDELVARGATVWHDGDADLRDRRVQEAVSSALIRSRFVVVAVDEHFRCSPWSRAEYLPCIEVERRAAASRVVVAQMAATASIPPELANAPCFRCFRHEDLDRLAAYVNDGNRLPFAVEQADDRPPRPYPAASAAFEMGRRILAIPAGDLTDAKILALRLIAQCVTKARNETTPQLLMAARQSLEETELSSVSAEELALFVAGARVCSQLPDSDDRANGLLMLLHLAEHDRTRDESEQVFEAFRQEPDDSLMHLGFPWFERNWGALDTAQKAVVERCAVRDPSHLKLSYPESGMVRGFSEVVRVKVFARGLETEGLSFAERMHLVEDRVDYVLGANVLVTGATSLDALRGVMGISDLEIIFHELDALLFAGRDWPEGVVEVLSARVVAAIDRIAAWSGQHDGLPLIAMDEWILDYVLKPLLWCSTLRTAADAAQRAFSNVCGVLEAWGAVAHEVPAYRQYLAAALSAQDMSAGLFSTCFQEARLTLERLHEEHRRRKR